MPKIRMPAMTSTVITGRRTKISAMFTTACAPLPTLTLVPGREPQLADGDDLLARLQAARDDGVVALGARDLDVAQLDGHVGLDDVDVLAVRAVLHRRRRRDDGVLLLVQRQHDVDELPGPERLVGIRELGLELDRAGRHVGGVVDERELARRPARAPRWRTLPATLSSPSARYLRMSARFCSGTENDT